MISIWVVYNRPEQWPNRFVAKRYEADEEGHRVTGDLLICQSKDDLQAMLVERGVTRVISSHDEKGTIEIWI